MHPWIEGLVHEDQTDNQTYRFYPWRKKEQGD